MMNQKPNPKIEFIVFFLFFLISVFYTRNILFKPGIIGEHDWPASAYKEVMRTYTTEFQPWRSAFLGQATTKTNPTFNLINEFFLLMTSPAIIFKLYIVVFLALSGFGMYYLCRNFSIERKFAFISGFLYFSSPFMFSSISGGYLTFLFALSLAPFSLVFFRRAIKNHDGVDYKHLVIAALLFSLCGTAIRAFLMLGIIFIIFALFDSRRLINGVKSLIVIAIIALLINFFWLTQSLFAIISPSPAGIAEKVVDTTRDPSWTMVISKKLSVLSSLRMLGTNPDEYFEAAVLPDKIPYWLNLARSHGYTGSVQEIGFIKEVIPFVIWNISSFILVILIFLSVLIWRRNKEVLLMALISLVGIFFAKGTSPPLEGLSLLFYKSPIGMVFRESTLWSFLTTFSYSVLLAFSLQGISRLMYSFHREVKVSIKKPKRYIGEVLKVILPLFMLSIFSWPWFTGNFAGNLNIFTISPSYESVYKEYSSDFTYRTFWTPMLSTGVSIKNNPHFSKDPLLHPGAFKTHLARFLTRTFSANNTEYLGHFLNFFNAKYIVYRGDFESVQSRYVGAEKEFNETLRNQKDLILLSSFDNDTIRVYENEQVYPRIYAPNLIFYSDGDFSDLLYSSIFPIPSGRILFLFTTPQTKNPISYTKNLLLHGDPWEIVFAQLPNEYFIQPEFFPNKRTALKGWSPIHSSWYGVYNWRSASIPEDGILSWVKDDLNISFNVQSEGMYEIWVKVFEGREAGLLTFLLDNEDRYEVVTKSSHYGTRWFKIMESFLTKGNHNLKVVNTLGEGLVFSVAIIPEGLIEQEVANLEELLQNKNIILYQEVEYFNYTSKRRGVEYFDNTTSVTERWFYQGSTSRQEKHLSHKIIFTNQSKGGYAVVLNKDMTISKWAGLYGELPWEDWGGYNKLGFWVFLPESSKVEYLTLKINGDTGTWYFDYGPFSDGWNFVEFDLAHPFFYGGVNKRFLEDEFTDFSSISSVYIGVELRELNDTMNGILWDNISVWPDPIKRGREYSGARALYVQDAFARDSLTIPISDQFKVGLKVDTFSGDYPRLQIEGEEIDMEGDFEEYTWSNPMELEGTTSLEIYAEDSLIDTLLFMDREPELSETPNITFRRISPTKYRVSVRDANHPFFLVFSETYDRNWKVYSGDVNWFKYFFATPILEDHHYVGNGYANVWYVEEYGNYELTLFYQPDSIYKLGLIVSFSTFLGCILYLFNLRKVLALRHL